MTTCSAIGPQACILAATFGYLVFAVAVVFIALAAMRAALDLSFALARFRASKQATLFGAEHRSPAPAPAHQRVIVFAPKKPRNRVVVR